MATVEPPYAQWLQGVPLWTNAAPTLGAIDAARQTNWSSFDAATGA